MIAATRRQVAALGGLAVVLAAVLWLQRDGGVPDGGAVSAPATGQAVAEQGPGQGVADVRLDLLEAQLRDDAPTRNPFEFGVPPPPPAAPVAPEPAVAPTEGPVARGAAVLPIPLRYIGRIDLPQDAGRVAVLSDNRGNVFHGRAGDVIEGRYRVTRVGLDSADLAYLDGRGQQTFQLSGQQ